MLNISENKGNHFLVLNLKEKDFNFAVLSPLFGHGYGMFPNDMFVGRFVSSMVMLKK